MKLYQFTLPIHSNNGLSYELARKQWAAEALKLAGGVTAPLTFREGTWKGEDRDYRELVAEYTVACTPKVYDALLAFAFDKFPDQEAIFTVELGEAAINSRPKAA